MNTKYINQIIRTVHEIDPKLIPISTVRPNAGFHTSGLAVDWWHEDLSRLYRCFITLHRRRGITGLGLGIDKAERHMHCDLRNANNIGASWVPVTWLETKPWNGSDSGEICWFVDNPPKGLSRLMWDQALARARYQYGMVKGSPIYRKIHKLGEKQ